MTYRNDTLYKKFRSGESGGKNHTETMQIKRVGQERLLIGYGNQIYAHRSPDGEVTKYIGWISADTSNTTNRQVSALKAERSVEARPMVLSWSDGLVYPDGAERIRNLGKNEGMDS